MKIPSLLYLHNAIAAWIYGKDLMNYQSEEDLFAHLKAEEGYYVFPKSNFSILTIFASKTIIAESTEEFYMMIYNSSKEENGRLWRDVSSSEKSDN